MRIQRPVVFIIKQATKTLLRKTVTATLALSIIAGSAFVGQNVLTVPEQAVAVSSSSACFAYTELSGKATITNYYDNEDNDAGKPPCPKDVSVPVSFDLGLAVFPVEEIGSVAFSGKLLTSVTIPEGVTNIADNAFSDNRLTDITLPSSLKSIGSYAFTANHLTAVTIPEGVTNIGMVAFAANQLTTVTVPSTVMSIDFGAFALQNPWGSDIRTGGSGAPNMVSSDPAEVQRAYDSIWYVQLFTSDTTNPNMILDNIAGESAFGGDLNANGTTTDSLGGHIVNPAHILISTQDQNGNSLGVSRIRTGIKTNGIDSLSGYQAVDGGNFAPSDPFEFTGNEEAILTAGFAQYHRASDMINVMAPAISGYTLVSPSSPASVTLAPAENTIDFRYVAAGSTTAPISMIDFSTPSGSATNPTPGSVPSGLPEVMKSSVFSADTSKECSAIKSAKLLSASDFTAPDAGQTTIGGLDFTIDCTTPGGDAAVSFTLGAVLPDLAKAKVYKQTAAGVVSEITSQVALTNESTPQGQRTVVRYSLRDGGALDDDKSVNGSIADPIFITVPSADSVALGVPNTGVNMVTESKEKLWPYLVVVVGVVVAGMGVAVIKRRKV